MRNQRQPGRHIGSREARQRMKLGAGAAKTHVAGTRSIQRMACILRDVVACQDTGSRLVDIAQRTAIEHSTVHRILKRLVVEGFVAQRRGTRLYTLGPLAYDLAAAATRRYDDIRRTCKVTLERLAQATGDTVFLSVRSDYDAICVDRAEGWFPIKTLVYEIGSRRPLGVGAGALALMLSMSPEEAEDIIEANAERISHYGSLSKEIVLELYSESRVLGYGWNEGLAVPGLSAIGLPIELDQGSVLGAISVVAISDRMSLARRSEILGLLQTEIATLSSQQIDVTASISAPKFFVA